MAAKRNQWALDVVFLSSSCEGSNHPPERRTQRENWSFGQPLVISAYKGHSDNLSIHWRRKRRSIERVYLRMTFDTSMNHERYSTWFSSTRTSIIDRSICLHSDGLSVVCFLSLEHEKWTCFDCRENAMVPILPRRKVSLILNRFLCEPWHRQKVEFDSEQM